MFVNIYWLGAFFCQSIFTFWNIYRKSSRAWFAGANKNSYRTFLIIEITLRDHTSIQKTRTLCESSHLILPPLIEGGGGYTVLPLSVCPSVRLSFRPSSVQDIFRRIFLSNYWWQKSDIWSQASYRYAILWEAFLDPLDSYFLFADFVDFYTHWTYMLIFRRIFLSNYWWQKSDIWSQDSYRYPISWEAFLHPSDSYFLFTDFVDFIHI